MNIALSTSNLVSIQIICIYCPYNYKGSSLSRITCHSLSTPITKQSIPFPLFTFHTPFRALDICSCFLRDQAKHSSASTISRSFSVRFLSLLNSICTRVQYEHSRTNESRPRNARLNSRTRPCPRKRHRKVLIT